jgi:DNA-binding MarR family transcriptional regulator
MTAMAPGRERARTPPDDGPALPLSALLSRLLVAFTIEFDNEFEHQMPHRTTRHGSTPGAGRAPWLVSMPMWVHCLRHVPAGGTQAAELIRRSKLEPKSARNVVQRMSKWWGYLTVDDAAKTIRPTAAGLQAQRVWAPLPAAIEARWRERFGADRVSALGSALRIVDAQFHVELPDFLPVGSPRLQPRDRHDRHDRAAQAGDEPDTALSALLSRVLLALALDFEDASDLSLGVYTDSPGSRLAISANVLRVLSRDETRAAEIPVSCGVAKMSVDNWLRILAERGYLETGPDPAGSRGRISRLTAKGVAARAAYTEWSQTVEPRWAGQYGADSVAALRAAAAALAASPAAESKLRADLEPYPDGWRAQVPAPRTLPHYPVISARGGFPDGH